MKRFKQIFSPGLLMCVLPVVLIVPNVALDITEFSSPLVKICNILLPLGIYMCIAGLSRKVGRTAVLCLPLMFFAAFQVVLLYLYGESIIAVDMYLNLVTTNVSEAAELLGNLGLAIATVAVIYLLPLIWGIVMWCHRHVTSERACGTMKRYGLATTCAGVLSLACCMTVVDGFRISRDIFPVNVINNMLIAARRTSATNAYAETSAAFDYRARSTRPSGEREIYVLVVGETSRADNWQLLGYPRPTNPRLSRRDSVIMFSKAISESNITHKSVPLALSCVSADNFGDSIYHVKSMVAAFRQAGFETAWLSNQSRNHSFIDFYADEAHHTRYLGDDGRHHFDHELLAPLEEFMHDTLSTKKFVVLHTYGSHFNYSERYPAAARHFTPDSHTQASRENRPQLINAYDNTIEYTDGLLDSVICLLADCRCAGAVIYFSDHGEDIFDDRRERFLHASPVPTYNQLHVPVALWLSPCLDSIAPGMYEAAQAHRDLDISSSRCVFDTMLHMAGIATCHSDPTKALTSQSFAEAPRMYLNDYNEGVPLDAAGIRDYDRDNFHKKHIAYK